MGRSRSIYDPIKVEKIKHLLFNFQQKGSPRSFEVYVDEMKVVDRSDNPEDFDTYQDFMDEDTKYIRIIIYYSLNSPRNEQYFFELNPSKSKPFSGELSGFELETKIDEKLIVERSKWETEQRQKEQAKEIQELKAKLTDAEEYITTLENSVEDLKTNGTKAKAGWGEIASVALEGIIRRNPQLLTAIPGGEALAGILSESPQQKAIEDTPQSEVSFQPKTESASTSTENSERLIVIKMIQDNFDPVQLAKVWEILKELSENPDSIQPVLELLQTS
jgi:hypothetical protein